MPRTTLLRKQVTPTGTIQPHAGSTAPEGFLVCDGAIVNIADYPRLYAIIGTSWGYGNNDGLTFHLPDLRGRFLRGSTEGMTPAEAALRDPDYASRTPSNTGGNNGDAVGSIQNHAFGSHNHGGGSHSHTVNVRRLSTGNNSISAGYETTYTNAASTNASGTIITTQGGAENRPINANVNYIIKAV